MQTAKRLAIVFVMLILALLMGVATAYAAGAEQVIAPPALDAAGKALLAAVFMATVANRLTEGLITPLFTKLRISKFYLLYIAWLIGGVLTWVTHVNLFAEFVPDPLTGQILTAIVAGGGANLIYDLFQVKPLKTVSAPKK